MDKRTNLAVIFGGRSCEHEVSLMSAASILEVIDRQKYHIFEIGITHTGEWLSGENVLAKMQTGQMDQLQRVVLQANGHRPVLYALSGQSFQPLAALDLAFPVLHGPYGEDGRLQGMLDTLGLPYAGAGTLASAVAMDKAICRATLGAHGMNVTPSFLVTRAEISNKLDEVLDRAEKLFAYPIFTKPVDQGSSYGISRCTDRFSLQEGLLEAARYSHRIFVERGIPARELEVGVLGKGEDAQVSVVGEIQPHAVFYTYEAKYQAGGSDLIIPAAIDPITSSLVQSMALEAFKLIDASGMARVDFLLDRVSGELFLSEVNTIPGFTPTSMYPRLWQASGVPYPALVDRLIELAERQ